MGPGLAEVVGAPDGGAVPRASRGGVDRAACRVDADVVDRPALAERAAQRPGRSRLVGLRDERPLPRPHQEQHPRRHLVVPPSPGRASAAQPRPRVPRMVPRSRGRARQPKEAIASTSMSTNRARSMSTPASTFGGQPAQPLGIGNGAAAGQLARRLHVHPKQPCRDQAGDGEVGNRDGVVDRRAVPAVALAVVDREETEEVDPDAGDPRAERLEPGHVGLQEEGLVGHVERDHGDRDAAPEDDGGGLRILPDVELRGRGRVPLPQRAAHQADALDSLADAGPRAQEERDVRERRGGDERDRPPGACDQRLRHAPAPPPAAATRPAPAGRRRRARSRRGTRPGSTARAGAPAPRRRPRGRRFGRAGPGRAARCAWCWPAASSRPPW